MTGITGPLVTLLLIDLVFLLVVVGAISLVGGKRHAGVAVLKRNFVGYFSNPLGYLFILLFVSLCSFCAFYPNDFFNDNLATLQQLNLHFAWVMLVYIPTITMGIWSEERRQGTDELLLTVPASDVDIVAGKYLAAVSIYTVSLVFSQISNFFVLAFLSQGEVDLGLFATTYLGYWLMGLSMIALGMVGSFLTRNLTIGFILGVLFNLPLVLGARADAIFSGGLARVMSRFSYEQQFFDFGRGVISFRSVVFFGLVIAIGLYLSVVLVGRRHWLGGRDGESLVGHYLIRVISLIVVALGLSAFFMNRDPWRIDGTRQQVNSLSKNTLTQILALKERLESQNSPAVQIEAFISKEIPEDYAVTRVDLVSKLREFEANGGNRIRVVIHDDLERFSDEAVRAEERYGIKPTMVMVRERGAIRQEEIFMGAAFTSGLEKVVVPFFDQGIPVEYELIRSICTVTDPQRKKLGIVNTDAQLFGGFDMQRMSQTPKQLIVEELEKQYEVVQIDPNNPIEQQVDVLMVVQPSSLTQPQMDNLVAAVKKGTPTAIFEDPMPVMMSAPGTSQPKMPRGGMFGMGGPPEPKGDIKELWNALGIKMIGNESFGNFDASVVWQDYNPYKKARGFRQISPEWVFASPEAPGGADSLNPQDEIVSGLQQILLLFPGAIQDEGNPALDVTPIITTGSLSGTIATQDLQMGANMEPLEFKRRPSLQPLHLAVRIRSHAPAEKAAEGQKAEGQAAADKASVSQAAPANTETLPVAEEGSAAADGPADDDVDTAADADATAGAAANPAAAPAATSDATPATTPPTTPAESAAAAPKIDVVYVGDIDLMHSEFLRVRAQPNMSDINWKFDNVTFVLNVIDDLAGDNRFLDVRKKQTRHSTLKFVETRTATARADADERVEEFNQEFERLEGEARKGQEAALGDLQKKIDELTQKAREPGAEAAGREMQRALQAAVQQMALKERVEQRRLDTTVEALKRKRDSQLREIERNLETNVQKVQRTCKAMALLLPMLPPLAIGLAVFIRRRSLESESITSGRRR